MNPFFLLAGAAVVLGVIFADKKAPTQPAPAPSSEPPKTTEKPSEETNE